MSRRRAAARSRAASHGDDRIGGEQVEGRQAVRELLRAQRRAVRAVWIATGLERSGALDDIVDLAARHGVRVHHVPPGELAELARTAVPQGVVAQAARLETVELDRLLAEPDAFLVALDGVTDPQNLGAILRTAETAGVTGVVLPRHRSASVSPTVTKAAAGAIEYLPLAWVAGIPAALDRARRAGLWVIGLDADGDTELFGLALADRPLVLVLGAEGHGLARLARARCDVVARIPMRGELTSLNVSAAAALACYEVSRRRARYRTGNTPG